jgi:peptide/nickel transport system substrate-binding protein
MRNRDFETLVGRSGGGLVPDPHDTLRSNAHNWDNRDEAKLTGQLAWRASWYVPEVNRLIEAGVAETDQEKRRVIYEEAQGLIEQAVPFVFPISQRVDPFARSTRLIGYPADPTWMVRWEVVSKAD